MRIYINIILLFMMLFYSGCSSKKRVVVVQKQIPAWYLNPPISNGEELYALGDGETKQEAITNALSMMLSTLSVSISSKFSAKTVVKEGSVTSKDSTYINNIQSDVKKIRISNYELIHSQKMGFKNYIVLVKSDKKELFRSMKKELEQRFDMIETKEEIVLKEDAIKQLSFYKRTKESLKNILNMLIVMNVLNKNFDDSIYMKKVQSIENSYSKLLSFISFSIFSNSDAKNLKAPIAKVLNSKHINIKDSKGKYHFRLSIKSHTQKADSYGFTLARSDISIFIKDYKGVIIASNKLNITGQSTQGYAIAKQNVAFKFNRLIQKDGIGKILGIDI